MCAAFYGLVLERYRYGSQGLQLAARASVAQAERLLPPALWRVLDTHSLHVTEDMAPDVLGIAYRYPLPVLRCPSLTLPWQLTPE